MNRKGCY